MFKKEYRKFLKQTDAKIKVSAVAVLMIAVALSSVFVLLPDTIVKAAPYDDWTKYKPINVYMSSGSSEENYSVLINVTYDSDMNNDFSDLRFLKYSDNFTELDYWIESQSDGNWANVWVELRDSITSSNTTLVKMFYGNGIASDAGDIGNAFIFGDDFVRTNSNDVGNDWWERDDSAGMTCSIDTNRLKMISDDSTGAEDVCVHNFTAPTCGYASHYEFNLSQSDCAFYSTMSKDNSKEVTTIRFLEHIPWDIEYKTSVSYYITGVTYEVDTWYTVECLYDKEGDGYYDIVIDGVTTNTSVPFWDDTGTSGTPPTPSSGNLFFYFWDETGTVYCDNCFIRKYEVNTPSYFIGTESSESGGDSSSFSLSGLDGDDRITWSGEAGETVWSNATVGVGGTLTIQTDDNSTDNCTAIYLDIADFDGAVIDADNISIEVRNTADGTFDGTTVALGSSPNYNLTIDDSAGAWFQGTNPFPIDGAGWTNVTLEVRFKCAIPGGAGTGTYVNTSASWNVLWSVES